MNNKEKEYYHKNRKNIDLKDIATWKYFPIGELRRKSYDYEYIKLEEYLMRYYKDFENKELWDKNWINSIILPLYNKDIDGFKKVFPNIENNKEWFFENRMEEYFDFFRSYSDFDDDILMFISYMKCYGFFDNQSLKYQEWINSKKYNIGGRHQVKEDKYTLKEMAKHQYGMNLVRDKLMDLEWHKR